jgi:hypothetical protein
LSDNPQYTRDLERELRQKLQDANIPDAHIGQIGEVCKDDFLPQACFDWDHGSQTPTVSPEVLVFIGTGKSANRFLKAAILGQNASFARLQYLVMTDGAKNADARILQQSANTGISILLTFPTKQILPQQKLSSTFEPLRNTFPHGGSQSYEEYGFDSMILISEALGKLVDSKKTISRGNLINELQGMGTWHGATSIYIFHEGENVHPDYSIYGAGTDQQMSAVQNAVCGKANRAPLPDRAEGLRYLCFVGFDEVNLPMRER